MQKTEERQAALDITEDSAVANLNARQIMLKHKAAHGSGSNLDFPDSEEIRDSMTGYPDKYHVEIYGDGSYTTPTIWWAALGGYGVWMPKWPSPEQATQSEITADSGEGAEIARPEGCPSSQSCIAGDISLLSFGAAVRGITSDSKISTSGIPSLPTPSQRPHSSETNSIRHQGCSRLAPNNARRALLGTLQSSIDGKAEADAKRRKLDPSNSWVGTDPKAINRDVETALKDPNQTGIHNRELRANLKRACTFEELAQSCKATKLEMRAILNICDTGKS